LYEHLSKRCLQDVNRGGKKKSPERRDFCYNTPMGHISAASGKTARMRNLYVHFPFCRRKCTYCALHSKAGASRETRDAYAGETAECIARAAETLGGLDLKTVYFGGGSPALCDLRAFKKALAGYDIEEWTAELHPLDVTEEKLAELEDIGVNRVSMGVQSLDDATLARMGRGYTADEAEKRFGLVRKHFENAGIDLIAGYPRDITRPADFGRLKNWGLRHCSVYSLILEEDSILSRIVRRGQAEDTLPSDDETMDAIRGISEVLGSAGLGRYEISNWAVKGFECRHNLAVWHGEDYIGLGEGAAGRIGLFRTKNWKGGTLAAKKETGGEEIETASKDEDRKERRLFALRTKDGLDARGFPEWESPLDHFASKGLLEKDGSVYRLTARGAEVCDSILAEII